MLQASPPWWLLWCQGTLCYTLLRVDDCDDSYCIVDKCVGTLCDVGARIVRVVSEALSQGMCVCW